MSKHDDYELYEKDYAEFIRIGMEAFGMEDHPGRAGYEKKGRDER